MLEWLQRLLARGDSPPLPTIAADVTGISLTIGGVSRAIPWSAIQRIAAFKQDLGSHDRIVLAIDATRSSEEPVLLSEDCPGFADLFGQMEAALGINPGWYLEIMMPAFEATPRVIYVREAQ
ncbi:MAG: hypothetical protein IPI38_09460 [Gemmatimonadetes bacterium]|jgi:hypothetical protein|nr:hypothetical protein [Gemmatimonadota bacterium]MBK7350021.1 hypothetical protein [Gemmatimonadota bacterium]MBK7715636.1 hypothetical protein [Gemmatimonadota bacterium]MBK7784649.1 hypothetical protein [Gemmatimonadota bacterium]MBK9066327.1 hypothetical protein [Gemmatimonadota bacterium]